MFAPAEWTSVGLASLAITALATDCLPSVGAVPSQPVLISQSLMVSQAGFLDRSRKDDRLVPAGVVVRAMLPPGCEFPFSVRSQTSPPDVVARCVT